MIHARLARKPSLDIINNVIYIGEGFVNCRYSYN